jgi:DNA polymerase zeta
MVKDAVSGSRLGMTKGVNIDDEDSELNLINRLIDIVREYDPDILCGYEVQSSSWGYVIERARVHFGRLFSVLCLLLEFDLCDQLSRMKSMSHGRFNRENDRWGFTHASAIRITGRHMMNIWRVMRGELNLTQYTLENITFHLLHRRSASWARLSGNF